MTRQDNHKNGTFVIRTSNNVEQFGAILFPLFNILSFVSAFFINIRVGVLAGIIIFMYVVYHEKCLKCFRDPVFTIFYMTNILSIYAYLFNERPFAIFASCITYNLFPMLMYGIGRANTTGERDDPVVKSFLFSSLVIVMIGFLIYFIPSLAARVNMDSMITAGISETGEGYRFASYIGSLELGSICAISIPLLLMFSFKRKLIKLLMIIAFSAALLLTMQRGAWIVGVASIVACMIVSTILDKKRIKTLLLYSILVIVLAYILVYFINHYMSEGLLQHLEIRYHALNYDAMSSGRSDQVSNAITLFLKYPLGFGLGAAGNKASTFHLQVIPDGNYLRILVETGVIGMFSFCVLNIKAIYSGIKNKYYYMTIIIGLFLAHSIGSNVLDFYYGSFIYWYFLGVLNRPRESFVNECDNINNSKTKPYGIIGSTGE